MNVRLIDIYSVADCPIRVCRRVHDLDGNESFEPFGNTRVAGGKFLLFDTYGADIESLDDIAKLRVSSIRNDGDDMLVIVEV